MVHPNTPDLFIPPVTHELHHRYPLNYVWARQAAPDTYKSGAGAARFWVVNMRKDLYVVYLRYPNEQNATAPAGTFRWGGQTVLESAKLSPSATLLAAPHQLRLSIQPTSRLVCSGHGNPTCISNHHDCLGGPQTVNKGQE